MKIETRLSKMRKRISKAGACWIYRGHTKQGYPIVRQNKKFRTAHRVFYELTVGPVASGLVLNHICRNRKCVNPKHLEQISNRKNILIGEGAGAKNARKVKCKHGHDFSKKNTYSAPGSSYRSCRKCMVVRTQKWRLKKREKEKIGL